MPKSNSCELRSCTKKYFPSCWVKLFPLGSFQASITDTDVELEEYEEEPYSGYLETLFRLDSDMISAELTGQAASLLTEKFSTGARKLIHFSTERLQWKAPSGSGTEKLGPNSFVSLNEEKASLQKKEIEPLLNEILEQHGQVPYYLDFLQDVYASWQALDHEWIALCRTATTQILLAHVDIALWQRFLVIADQTKMFEDVKDTLTPAMLQIFIVQGLDKTSEINESVHDNISFIQSLLSIWEQSLLEASDYLANYGSTLSIRELLCLVSNLCVKNEDVVLENYDISLDWLSGYGGCPITTAALVVLSQKMMNGDKLPLCANEENCVRHMFIRAYPTYGDKIEVLDNLGFYLMKTSPNRQKTFCIASKFWKGYAK